jgi:integrase
MTKHKKLPEKVKKQLLEFESWLQDAGYTDGTAHSYTKCVAACQRRKSILAPLHDEVAASTRVIKWTALKQWAKFTKDTKLLEELESGAMKRLMKKKGSKPRKIVQPLSPEEWQAFKDALESIKKADLEDGLKWIWPVLSLFCRLGLRAGVDLCGIDRSSAEAALKTGQLEISSKGDRVRVLPAKLVSEELELLLSLGKWKTLADLISPGAKPESKQRAAYSQISKMLKSIAKSAGMDPKLVHSHRFRHTIAVELYKKSGHNLVLVQKFLGHALLATTQGYLEGSDQMAELDDLLEEI